MIDAMHENSSLPVSDVRCFCQTLIGLRLSHLSCKSCNQLCSKLGWVDPDRQPTCYQYALGLPSAAAHSLTHGAACPLTAPQDFATRDAFRFLERYRDSHCCCNDGGYTPDDESSSHMNSALYLLKA